MQTRISDELLSILICPKSREALQLGRDGDYLIAIESGYKYPIVDGIPVLINEFAQGSKIENE